MYSALTQPVSQRMRMEDSVRRDLVPGFRAQPLIPSHAVLIVRVRMLLRVAISLVIAIAVRAVTVRATTVRAVMPSREVAISRVVAISREATSRVAISHAVAAIVHTMAATSSRVVISHAADTIVRAATSLGTVATVVMAIRRGGVATAKVATIVPVHMVRTAIVSILPITIPMQSTVRRSASSIRRITSIPMSPFV